MDVQTLSLMACVALLLVAGAAVVLARGAKAEVARLRAEGEAALRQLQEARTASEVARAHAEAQDRVVGDRDQRLQERAREVEALRRNHQDAESRCAKATEAAQQLEAAIRQLREDHVGMVRQLREDGAQAVQRLRDEAAEMTRRLDATHEELGKLRTAHSALEKERDERLASAEREVARLAGLREEMTKEFQALAAATLRDTGAQFSEANHQKLTELLTPFREQVGRFEAELRAVHQEADKDRAILAEQIRAVAAQAQEVSRDAANLAQALKGDKQRQGAWGEAQLERYLELMGFRRDVDYEVQASRTAEEGHGLRPDVILHLPGGKALVIDSKVSLSAYADAIAAGTEEERDRCLKLHARNVRARVDELAARDYHRHVDGSMDWVLLFMPVEGAVSAAWTYDAEIATYAMERGVALAYPTTLLMSLKTVRHLWDVEKRNKNAEAIAERAGRLYDKLANFIDSFEQVGRALETARSAHDRARGQLVKGNGNLVRQVEQLKELGARTGKTLGVAHDAEAEGAAVEVLPPANDDAPRAIPAAE